ncbi:MAG: LysR family transcriptional regulator [Pseudomonas sp.]|jgi:DNA-binding transcriptional LysR family regulator|uniref:LysR substrate-binding domain-containing protein n=1 Tax=Pseudomonas sp. TaxID=306 RepID=UPI002615C055|nr:LysR family transcriptional regulator [Pseudomonas sp.]MDB6050936.1 LysR family transcriptional regulator [Pseudomonas sp.]
MFDLELLRTFVSVVDAGGFTKAGERVNRTQSTVSQQIRKLEEQLGRPLLLRQRAGKTVQLTEDGEKLLGYARRLVALSFEAHSVLSSPEQSQVVKLGVPEDFDVQRLMVLLSGFSHQHPLVRLDTLSGLSVDLHAKLETKEIDLALVKRDCKQSSAPALCQWPEHLTWVAGLSMQTLADPLPLAVFPQGCIYRERIIHALESAGRRWRVAFASQSLVGIQAAVSAGLGISLLPSTAVLAEHRPLGIDEGFIEPPPSELALISTSRLMPPVHRTLADYLKTHLSRS